MVKAILPTKKQQERLALLERGLKRCTKCGETKPVSDFGKKSGRWDGLDSWCRQCNHDSKQEYRSNPENREKEREQSKSWKRRNRQRVKEYNAQWNAENPDIKKRLRRRWHLAHKEEENRKSREKIKQWARENPRKHNALNRAYRARKFEAEGYHTDDQIEKLYELCDHRCLVCGKTENLAVDHIVPLKEGGTNWIDNLQILCKSHNGAKGDHHSIDYRPDHVREWAEEQVE